MRVGHAGILGLAAFLSVAPSPKSPVASAGPFTWSCTPSGGGTGTPLQATFYKTQPSLVLLTRDGTTHPAFQVRSGSGAKYEGDGVMFWEARGEASVMWSDAALTCKRR